jgi:hypothetical protein
MLTIHDPTVTPPQFTCERLEIYLGIQKLEGHADRYYHDCGCQCNHVSWAVWGCYLGLLLHAECTHACHRYQMVSSGRNEPASTHQCLCSPYIHRKKKKKTTDQVNWPLGNIFMPSMKSQNGIFWMVQWWVLGHSNVTSAKKLTLKL